MTRPAATRANAQAEYADLLARADADPNVVGLVVFGSRGFDAFVTDDSDFDVLVVVNSMPESWRTLHGSGVEALADALRAAGHGAVVEGWAPDVEWLRGVAS